MAITMTWNVSANKRYESGIDRPVLYVRSAGTYPLGVPWEGVTSVTEKPSGAEATDLWANNVKYAQMFSPEIFDFSLEAFTYPDEFLACDGVVVEQPGALVAGQPRVPFGLCYRTWNGSDQGGQKEYYKIHIIYGATVQPSEVPRSTINDSPENVTFSWEAKTIAPAITVAGLEPASKFTIDSRLIGATELAALESQLYGDDVGPITANLPLPDALIALVTPV